MCNLINRCKHLAVKLYLSIYHFPIIYQIMVWLGKITEKINYYTVRVHLTIILLAIISFGFYGVHVRQYKLYKEYNRMNGVVTAVFKGMAK